MPGVLGDEMQTGVLVEGVCRKCGLQSDGEHIR